ncbi:MAG: flagellar basal body rod protein FlgB [Lachnospiraceae bacterium]|jgi:flagellar basal-body rod protein FlgB|nr:flagellar basal body rod protein FlgB [Lachnospiraceae bacterium]SDA55520.1 flagellar basal-body rod protein FlgB [Lachnospiraceae bacterium G11]
MFSSGVFNYINLLDKAADGAWARHEAISNNIANQDTPGYKRQDVDFESELKKALRISRYTENIDNRNNLDKQIANLNFNSLKPKVFTDMRSYSYRLDGNNVDPDTEGVYLAANQTKYNGIMASINNEFDNLSRVMQ